MLRPPVPVPVVPEGLRESSRPVAAGYTQNEVARAKWAKRFPPEPAKLLVRGRRVEHCWGAGWVVPTRQEAGRRAPGLGTSGGPGPGSYL